MPEIESQLFGMPETFATASLWRHHHWSEDIK
jgi:hypothetical protein